MSYFQEPCDRSKSKIKVALDLCNYTWECHWKNVTGVDTSTLAKKDDLANLKSDIDKLVICKLQTTPADLSKLRIE